MKQVTKVKVYYTTTQRADYLRWVVDMRHGCLGMFCLFSTKPTQRQIRKARKHFNKEIAEWL